MLILWDIDKTLVHQRHPRDLFLEASHVLGGSLDSSHSPRKDGKTDAQIAREYLKASDLSEELLPRFMSVLEQLSEERLCTMGLYATEGAKALLLALDQRDVNSGVYTGNTPLRARAKLTLAGIDPDALLNGLDEA